MAETPCEATLRDWESDQRKLARVARLEDSPGFDPFAVRLVGGVDISFLKNTQHAVGCLVIYDLFKSSIVYTDHAQCVMTVPYIPGFLSYREVPVYRQLLARLSRCSIIPEVLLVDGHGSLHYRGCGAATALGVTECIKTVGVGKQWLQVDDVTTEAVLSELEVHLPSEVGAVRWVERGGRKYACALRCSADADPCFVSAGHGLSQDSAVRLAQRCCASTSVRGLSQVGVPIPVHLADKAGRLFVKQLQGSTRASRSRRCRSRRTSDSRKKPKDEASSASTMTTFV
eukprot:TRINITY_DN2867_c0_g1_i1.p1 TRINITY_DN2867_c0_g1~~TRINITY_DN2867_c0_g1_i1.p1  ORF type:complete len:286 (-),score=45.22 TRINITY_DN2867_c0_g1_i1:205-1062(-)